MTVKVSKNRKISFDQIVEIQKAIKSKPNEANSTINFYAKKLDVHRRTIKRNLDKLARNENFYDTVSIGAPKVFTEEVLEKCYQLRKEEGYSIRKIVKVMRLKGINISRSTVHNFISVRAKKDFPKKRDYNRFMGYKTSSLLGGDRWKHDMKAMIVRANIPASKKEKALKWLEKATPENFDYIQYLDEQKENNLTRYQTYKNNDLANSFWI